MHRKLFIDGAWVEAAQGESLAVINPATEQIVDRIAAASAADIDRAVAAAERAFSGPWRQTSRKDRATYLRAFAREIAAGRDDLARLEVVDNGKPLAEAGWDINDTIACFEFYAQLAEGLDTGSGEELALPDSRFRCRVRRQPVGVVGQIIPWNYPMLMAAWKVCPALAAGCTIVLKPSEHTSLTALELGAIAQRIGLPNGVLNIVTGTGDGAGRPLSIHPSTRKIAFTGSLATGRKIMAAAAQDIKNVTLELGGKSSLILFADTDIEAAVEWIMFGGFWNQGQVCSATARVLIHASIFKEVVDRLVTETRKLKVGNGLDAGTQLGPLVCQSQLEKVCRAAEIGRREGAKLLIGGGHSKDHDVGYFFEPTVFVDAPSDSFVWSEEIFGPIVCLRAFETEVEAIRLANDTQYGLAAAIMSSDPERVERVADALEVGIVWINCSQPTFVEAPWGRGSTSRKPWPCASGPIGRAFPCPLTCAAPRSVYLRRAQHAGRLSTTRWLPVCLASSAALPMSSAGRRRPAT